MPGEAETKMAACAWQLLAGTAHERLLLVGEDADLLLTGSCAAAPQRMRVSVLPRLPQLTESDEDWTNANLVCQAPTAVGMGGEVAMIALLEAGNDYLPAVRDLQLGTLWRVYAAHMQTDLKETTKPLLIDDSGGINVCQLVKLLHLMDQDLQRHDASEQRSAAKEFLWAPGGHTRMFEVQNYLQVNNIGSSQGLHAALCSRPRCSRALCSLVCKILLLHATDACANYS